MGITRYLVTLFLYPTPTLPLRYMGPISSLRPFCRQYFSLLQDGLCRFLLLVGRVAVLGKNTLHEHTQFRVPPIFV